MSAHTPGPWLVRGLHIVGPADVRSQHPDGRVLIGGVVDDANDWRGHLINSPIERAKFAEERKANARLIAAAPDLLEAARAAYTRLADILNDWYGRHTSEGQRLLCMLRDAISKATGMDAEDVQDAASVPQATGAQS